MVGDFAVDLGDWFEAHATEVKANLERYFLGVGGPPFNGRHFERFSAMGDPNRFEATDVLAVEAPSVKVPPNSAARLILDGHRREKINRAVFFIRRHPRPGRPCSSARQ